MKKLGTIFFISILTCKIIGQEMGYTQNMFNLMYVNPGYAGSTDMFCIQPLFRQQWLGLVKEGAPISGILNINAPFTLFEKSHGVGLSIIDNKYGYNNDIGIKLSYAYRSKVSIGDGMVGIGISLGMINSNDQFSKLAESMVNPEALTDERSTMLDLGLGVYYKTDKLYMGISGIHLIPAEYTIPSKARTLNGGYFLEPQVIVTAGYIYQLPNPMVEIVPSFFIQSIGKSTVINFNTNIVYNNRIWGGVSFRDEGAVSGLFGIELMPGIKFGVSYDYETSNNLAKVNDGSVEVTVLYSFKLKKEKVPQRYKSIRFL